MKPFRREVVRMGREGATLTEIYKATRVRHEKIARYLKAAGIPVVRVVRTPSNGLCEVDGCNRAYNNRHEGRRLCIGHLRRAQGVIPADRPIKHKATQRGHCRVLGCKDVCDAKNLCRFHYGRMVRLGPDATDAQLSAPRLRHRVPSGTKLEFRAPPHVVAALRRRAANHRISISALLRAIAGSWADTAGAPAVSDDSDVGSLRGLDAWRRLPVNMEAP